MQLLRYFVVAALAVTFLIMVFGRGRVYFDFALLISVALLILQLL